jgi:hypothetical protein
LTRFDLLVRGTVVTSAGVEHCDGGARDGSIAANESPSTVDGASFDLEVAAAEGTSFVDFALRGGFVPGAVDRLEGPAPRGRIAQTILRGSTVGLGEDIVASPEGRRMRPRPGRSTEARS